LGRQSAEQVIDSIRQHLSIKNNLQLSSDVIFKKDESLKKKGHSSRNYNIILKMALAMIDKEKSSKAF